MWLVFFILGLFLIVMGGIIIVQVHSYNEQRFKEEEKRSYLTAILTISIGSVFGIIFMAWTAPWWHWLWFNVCYMAPTIWIGLILIALIAIFGKTIARIVSATLAVLFLITCAVLVVPLTQSAIYSEISSQGQTLSNLPQTTGVRFTPMEVAEYYGHAKVEESEIVLGSFQLIFLNDEPVWVAPREPNGMRAWTQETDGIAIVGDNATVTMDRQPFEYGEGMVIQDNILWQLRRANYWVEYPEIFYQVESNGVIVAVAPKIGYKYHFPVMVPYWAGVTVVYPDGKIKDYDAQEALSLNYSRLFPEKLARLYVESWRYNNGVWNKWFTHRDQLQIPNTSSENQMPYLTPTERGLEWITATNPLGSSGIFKIFFTDARTGKTEVWQAPRDANLVGIGRISQIIQSAYPLYDWYAAANGKNTGTIRIIEPRPIITSTNFYWMVTLTTSDFAFSQNTPNTILVNAKTTETMAFKSKSDVEQFIKTGKVAVTTQPSAKTGPDLDKIRELLNEILQELNK